jgi:hypothetical protein
MKNEMVCLSAFRFHPAAFILPGAACGLFF